MARTEPADLRGWRRRLLAPLSGTVVETGAGPGRNLDHYPAGVTRIVLSEPDPRRRARLEQRVAHRPTGPDLTVVDGPAAALPVPDGGADAVVATLVLCSVPELDTALREFRRVLRPGGRLAYLEHVSAFDSPKRANWQRRVEPVWKRVLGNCHLTRRTDQAILDAGFETEEERREDLRGALPLMARTVRGTAVAPGVGGR
jgi:ubiquinone/menaquinone biosynthesis C-methylase UbiE